MISRQDSQLSMPAASSHIMHTVLHMLHAAWVLSPQCMSTQNSNTDQVLVEISILPQVARREELGDQVDAVRIIVLPALEALRRTARQAGEGQLGKRLLEAAQVHG